MLVKKKIKFILALSLLLLGLMRFTSAAVPKTVNYQGRLSDAANIPLSGQYDFRFRLYDDAAKTNLLWGPEEHLDQTVDNGYVSVQLGSIASFEAAGLDFTDQYWLTVQIKENTAGTWDDETDPPVEFSSYSYALNSEKVVSPTGEVNVGETIQGGSALVGAETAFGINTGSGFSGDLLALSNDSTNYLTIDSVGDAYFSNMQKINMENNSVNNLIGLKVTNTNDVDNYAGSILELKGSGPDYTNNVYFGKYGDGFWVPSWAGNGVLATDQDLILGSMGSSDVTNPNADPRILFQIGGGYSTPITTAIMESDGLELLPYDTVAGATSGLRFRELAANGSNYVSLQASDAMASDLNFVLPNSYGSNGEFLTTDGTGNLSWGSAPAPTVANGLYNDAGTIKLGGNLTETTYINHMGWDLVVREFAGEPATYFAGDNFKIEDTTNDRVVRFGSAGVNNAGLSFESSTNEHDIYYRDNALYITSDNLAFAGLEYAADYSTDFTDRSLVDKGYVDGLSAGAAGNGLTWDAGNTEIDLGGSLTESTVIDAGFFQYRINANNSYTLFNQSNVAYHINDGTNNTNWVQSSTAAQISGTGTFAGIEYQSDYSANYTERSLVDKAYVDSKVGGSVWDADADTGIQVEESLDEDMIRFDIGNSSGLAYPNAMVINNLGNVGIANSTPHAMLDIGEAMIATPSGDTSIILSHDGGESYIETLSGDMSEGLLMHGTVSATTDSGIIKQIYSNGYTNGWVKGLHIFNKDAEPIIFKTSDTEVARLDASGNLGVGTTSPQSKVDIYAGDLRLSNTTGAGCLRYNNTLNQLEYSNDCTTFNSFTASSGGGWTDDGSVVRLTTGTDQVVVGANTDSSGADSLMTLTTGAFSGPTLLRLVDDSNSDIQSQFFFSGNALVMQGNSAGNGGALLFRDYNIEVARMLNSGMVVNESGDPNIDFRVEGDTDPNLFYIDAGTDKIGLGNNSPNAFLDISSSIADAIRINPYGINAGNTGHLEFMELAANGSNYVGFKAPENIATDVAWVLPNADGSNGEVLSTDGTGNLSWVSAPAPTVANGLYNDTGTIKLGGDLTETTYINHMGWDFVVREFAGEPATYFAGDNFKIEDTTNDRVVRFGTSGADYAGLSFESSTNEHNIYYRDNALHITSDNLTFAGLQYASDYSADYTARSLIDKEYVDLRLGLFESKLSDTAIGEAATSPNQYARSFVVGSPQLDDDGNTAHDARMFFDKATGAFRVGQAQGTQWDSVNRGANSFATGNNNTVSGMNSFAAGQYNTTAASSVFLAGEHNTATRNTSTVIGRYNNASGSNSVAIGSYVNVHDYGEIGFGINSIQGTGSSTGLLPNNQIFHIGNGGNATSRSNAMTVLYNGNVGFGTITPSTILHVVAEGAAVATFDRKTDDGVLISLRQDNVEEGTITVSGNTVSYNAFTGSHYVLSDETITKGMLVELTGKNKYLHNDKDSEILYGVKPSSTLNSPKILGSYLSKLEPKQKQSTENPSLVMAEGNGDLWVVDTGDDIEAGDYLISSDVEGHAQLVDDNFAVNYVVARAAEDVDWSEVNSKFSNKKHKLISVFFDTLVINTETVKHIKYRDKQGSLLLRDELDEMNLLDNINDSEIGEEQIENENQIDEVEKSETKKEEMQFGQTIVKSKQIRKKVKFNKAFSNKPIVLLTLASDSNLMRYYVSNVDEKGFSVNIYPSQLHDTLINWQALPNQNTIDVEDKKEDIGKKKDYTIIDAMTDLDAEFGEVDENNLDNNSNVLIIDDEEEYNEEVEEGDEEIGEMDEDSSESVDVDESIDDNETENQKDENTEKNNNVNDNTEELDNNAENSSQTEEIENVDNPENDKVEKKDDNKSEVESELENEVDSEENTTEDTNEVNIEAGTDINNVDNNSENIEEEAINNDEEVDGAADENTDSLSKYLLKNALALTLD